jgi:peptidoglycan/xylan/chitin deacetylase (PgdA/CDA1 family)
VSAASRVRAITSPETADQRLRLRDLPMILMYHGVADVPVDPHRLHVTPARFTQQMTWLRSRGLRGVGVGELAQAIREGRQRGLVGITFDDGYASVLDMALPELQRQGFGATVFVISGRLGGTNEWDEGPAWPLLTAEQVTELAEAGLEIGSHTATHVRLAGLGAEQLKAEAAGSKAALTSLLGKEIHGFAYPYGSIDAAAQRAVHDAGYQYACSVDAAADELGFMALPRIYMGQRDNAARMPAKHLLYRSYIAARRRQRRHW